MYYILNLLILFNLNIACASADTKVFAAPKDVTFNKISHGDDGNYLVYASFEEILIPYTWSCSDSSTKEKAMFVCSLSDTRPEGYIRHPKFTFRGVNNYHEVVNFLFDGSSNRQFVRFNEDMSGKQVNWEDFKGVKLTFEMFDKYGHESTIYFSPKDNTLKLFDKMEGIFIYGQITSWY